MGHGMGPATVAICAIVKDEGPYLDEWIQYHLGLGFDHVCLYDNSDAHELAELHGGYGGRVEVRHLPGAVQQLFAYNHFLHATAYNHFLHATTAEWCAFIDVDEFIVLRRHTTIHEFVAEHCRDGAVCLNWYLFGSSGHLAYSPKPVLQRFQMRQEAVNPHVKSIVRCRDAEVMLDPHVPIMRRGPRVDTSGRPVNGPLHPGGPSDVAVIHHYFTKSRGEYEAKVRRGRADIPERRSLADFEAHDCNEVVDSSAWDAARAMVGAVNTQDLKPGV